MKKLFLIFVMAVALSGCITMREIRTEAGNVTPTEVTTFTQPIADFLDGMVDDPIHALTAGGMGYLIAILRRAYKKKKGCKT